jgi:hypothetical protein
MMTFALYVLLLSLPALCQAGDAREDIRKVLKKHYSGHVDAVVDEVIDTVDSRLDKHDFVFVDEFDYLDHDKWEHEITAAGGGCTPPPPPLTRQEL